MQLITETLAWANKRDHTSESPSSPQDTPGNTGYAVQLIFHEEGKKTIQYIAVNLQLDVPHRKKDD